MIKKHRQNPKHQKQNKISGNYGGGGVFLALVARYLFFLIFFYFTYVFCHYLGVASVLFFLILPMYFNENGNRAQTGLYIAPGAAPAVQTQKSTKCSKMRHLETTLLQFRNHLQTQ